ncbi:glycosyltransferase family 9 protein [Methylovorus mays]|uniref:glycosyltransferase family 9 protein n=1 Tax=Methylovorus mays TaxID=184077 RepID=UPI001E567B96|nr:glycosyltransferase family 9 protein [Methylovorus mays]MCB5206958.1 glycosyltransferase family 9 protein [Methylovorus mays]
MKNTLITHPVRHMKSLFRQWWPRFLYQSPGEYLADQLTVQRILLVSLSNIGDAVLTTPCLQALHQRYPAAVMDIVVDPRSQAIFSACPYLGRLFVLDKKGGWRGRVALMMLIRRQQYDLALDLRSDWMLYFIRARRKLGKLSIRAGCDLHSAEKHVAALKPLDIQMTPETRIWINPRDRRFAQVLLGGWSERRILALGLGANFEGKIWPVAHFITLVNMLADSFDGVLLLGNQQDASRAEAFSEGCRLPVIHACGQCDLLETAALLEHAGLFVGNDSGLGHMASAMGTPTMTLFGPGFPARYRPWGPSAGWLQSQDGTMQSLTPAEVAAYIRQKWAWVRP